jgi:hypothetical protein
MSNHAQAALIVLALASLVFVLVRTGIANVIFTVWCMVAMIVRAIAFIALGLLCLFIAYWIATHIRDNWLDLFLAGYFRWDGGNWLIPLLAGFLVWQGANCIFSALGNFVTGPSRDSTTDGATTATRAALRRAGLIRRR